MHYVYFLQSKVNDSLYIGNTNNLERRLDEHNRGEVCYTRIYKPFRLVYYEAYLHRKDALERENKLKHHGSVIGHLKRRIKRSLEGSIPPKGRDSIRPFGVENREDRLTKIKDFRKSGSH